MGVNNGDTIDVEKSSKHLAFMPLAQVAASLIFGKKIGTTEAAEGMLQLMKIFKATERNIDAEHAAFNKIAKHLLKSREMEKLGWEADARILTKNVIIFAAARCDDEVLKVKARGVASECVTLRPNNSSTWGRYAQILEIMGDMVGSENATRNQISLGAGEGNFDKQFSLFKFGRK